MIARNLTLLGANRAGCTACRHSAHARAQGGARHVAPLARLSMQRVADHPADRARSREPHIPMPIILIAAALAAILLAVVHVLTPALRFLEGTPRSVWLSIAGGVSVAYVFVH